MVAVFVVVLVVGDGGGDEGVCHGAVVAVLRLEHEDTVERIVGGGETVWVDGLQESSSGRVLFDNEEAVGDSKTCVGDRYRLTAPVAEEGEKDDSEYFLEKSHSAKIVKKGKQPPTLFPF